MTFVKFTDPVIYVVGDQSCSPDTLAATLGLCFYLQQSNSGIQFVPVINRLPHDYHRFCSSTATALRLSNPFRDLHDLCVAPEQLPYNAKVVLVGQAATFGESGHLPSSLCVSIALIVDRVPVPMHTVVPTHIVPAATCTAVICQLLCQLGCEIPLDICMMLYFGLTTSRTDPWSVVDLGSIEFVRHKLLQHGICPSFLQSATESIERCAM